MGSMSEFFTREKANKGIKIELKTPDGKDEWVEIYGADADIIRENNIKINRQMRDDIANDVVKDGTPEADKYLENLNKKQRAAFIKNWSFDEELTEENKLHFISNAPHIADEIELRSKKRELLFTKISKLDENGSSTKSDLTNRSEKKETTQKENS